MPALSSNTLFHFTGTFEQLVGILTNEFRPHYSLEDLSILHKKPSKDKDLTLAFPMVSFCDIPLSQATTHMGTYGRYALGLSKTWGQKRGLTPIMYVHRNAATVRGLLDLIRLARSGDEANKAIMKHVTRLLLFSKPYVGRFWRGTKWIENVRFYDEREWRFVLAHGDGTPALSRDDFIDVTNRKKANDALGASRLPFAPRDIKYVIVKSESEILPIVREIERIKGKYSLDEVKVLTSRVISAEQILEDF